MNRIAKYIAGQNCFVRGCDRCPGVVFMNYCLACGVPFIDGHWSKCPRVTRHELEGHRGLDHVYEGQCHYCGTLIYPDTRRWCASCLRLNQFRSLPNGHEYCALCARPAPLDTRPYCRRCRQAQTLRWRRNKAIDRGVPSAALGT